MMRYCKNCGTQLRDGASFCPKCGNPVAQPRQEVPNAGYVQPGQAGLNAGGGNPMPQKGNKKAIGIIAGIIGLIVVAVVLIVSLSGRDYNKSYKAAAETWLKAYATRDFELLLKAWPPEEREFFRDCWLWDYDDEDEYWDDFYEYIEYRCGSDVKMSYELVNVERVGKDEWGFYEEEIEFAADYSGYEYYECDISACYDVEVVMIFQGVDGTYTRTDCLTIAKIKGKWYVVQTN